MTPPRVSIIVPCRNERAAIDAFLDSVFSQSDVPGGFEVIVADGCSDDGTLEILRQRSRNDPRLRVITNAAQTVSPGLNLAIQAARGTIIVRMDVHSEYSCDYVARCVETLERTGATNVGGPALARGHLLFQRANAMAYRSPFAVGGARFHDPNFEGWVDTVTYGCWYRQSLIELGMFDETLVRNQDDELNLRIVRSGGRIWQTPSIRSWYYPRATIQGLARQYYQYGYWKVAVIAKHRLPASWRHLVPVSMLVVAGTLAVAGFGTPAAWAVLAALAACYVALVLIASVVEARRNKDWRVFPVLPIVFATYHWSYGVGFGVAMFRRLCGRPPGASAVSLTR